MEFVLKVLGVAVASGAFVEGVKVLWSNVLLKSLSPKLVPIIASLIGALIGWAAEYLLPGLGITPDTGSIAGLVATALHQIKNQPWLVPSPKP
jgi:hypothetical protein